MAVKFNSEIKNQFKAIGIGQLLLSVIEQGVFLVIPGAWSVYVLIGNIIMSTVMVFNYYYLAVTIDKALSGTADDAKRKMLVSRVLRTVIIIGTVAIVYVIVSYCGLSMNMLYSMLPPLVFNRIIIAVYSAALKRKQPSLKNTDYGENDNEKV